MDDNIIMSNVHRNHLPDDIPLSALDCDDFRPYICAVDTELETTIFGRRSAQKRFMHASRVHSEQLGCRVLLPAADGFELLFTCSGDNYIFSRGLAMALKEHASRFGGEFFQLLRGMCNVSQLIMDKMYARPLLLADFRNVPNDSQLFQRRAAFFERRASDQFVYHIPYECVEVVSSTDFFQLSRYVPRPSK